MLGRSLVKFHGVATIAIAAGMFSIHAAAPANAKGEKLAYVPGLTLSPDVLQSDGTTVRIYQTDKGPGLWSNDLPIKRGDQIRLNVFEATGGSELARVVVRLDNSKIAELHGLPWNTTIDTAKLSPGYHMVEVWGQSDGDRPQAATRTWQFYVMDELPVRYEVKGEQDELISRPSGASDATVATVEDDSTPPSLPFSADSAPNASVRVRADDVAADAALLAGNRDVTVDHPILFYVQALPGSAAVRYAYAITRHGHTVVSSPEPLSLSGDQIKLQERTDDMPGMHSGKVMLWVWGIDRQGRASEPVAHALDIE